MGLLFGGGSSPGFALAMSVLSWMLSSLGRLAVVCGIAAGGGSGRGSRAQQAETRRRERMAPAALISHRKATRDTRATAPRCRAAARRNSHTRDPGGELLRRSVCAWVVLRAMEGCACACAPRGDCAPPTFFVAAAYLQQSAERHLERAPLGWSCFQTPAAGAKFVVWYGCARRKHKLSILASTLRALLSLKARGWNVELLGMPALPFLPRVLRGATCRSVQRPLCCHSSIFRERRRGRSRSWRSWSR